MRNNSPSINKAYAARQLGLTLIELLVAISILGMVAVLGWRGLDSIVRARIELTSELGETRGMQLTFAQLQSDCAHLADPSILANKPPLFFAQNQLELVRTVFSDDQPTQLEVVTYLVNDGILTRHESMPTRDLKILGALWQTSSNHSFDNQGVKLQSGVSSMTTRLWVSGGNTWLPDMKMISPAINPGSSSSPPSPTGLEITIMLQGKNIKLVKIFLLGAT